MQNDDDNYRCELTIDIEEMIQMSYEKKETKAIGKAVYKSGRVEEFSCNLRACGNPTKQFLEKQRDLEAFPTVVRVDVERV